MVIECLPGVETWIEAQIFLLGVVVQPRVFVSYILREKQRTLMSLTHIGTCSSSFFSTSLFSSFSSVGCAAIVTKSASRLPNWSWTPSPGVIMFVPSGFSDEGCFSANEGSSSSWSPLLLPLPLFPSSQLLVLLPFLSSPRLVVLALLLRPSSPRLVVNWRFFFVPLLLLYWLFWRFFVFFLF